MELVQGIFMPICINCNKEKEMQHHMDVCEECIDDEAHDIDVAKQIDRIEKFEKALKDTNG